MPKWDPVSQKKVREALIVLASTLTDTGRAFGLKNDVDPLEVRVCSKCGTRVNWDWMQAIIAQRNREQLRF